MRYADAHMHPMGKGYRGSEDAALLSVCSADFSDWDIIYGMKDQNIVRSYGVHPWNSEGWGDGSLDRLRQMLENDPDANIGEIGLDEAKGPSMVDQARCFEEQFSLASELNKTVSIHSVRAENYVLAAVKRNHKGCKAVILHSFSAPVNYIKSFSKYDCYFSISPRILGRQRVVAEDILRQIPEDRMLLETDAPDYGHDFTTMDAFISEIASMIGTDPEGLAEKTLVNAERALR